MDELFVQKVLTDSLLVTMSVGAPMLLSGMIVGLIVSIFQATTSIQEQTLTFVPKVIVIFSSIVLFGPWIIKTLLEYSLYMVDLMVMMGKP